MNDDAPQANRRAMLSMAGSVLSTAALSAALAAPAAATDASASSKDNAALEKQNIALVTQFCQAWSSKDVEKLIPFISAEIEYHMFEGAPPIKGVDQFRERLGKFMSGMKEITWEIFRSHAMGDIVINERIDHFIQGPDSKRPDNHFHITGVFLVRDGKISYWADYNMPKKG